ncbi:hypothetical protein [Paraliomyxa miuraensis]|uniref:hypothetical protein n=1 Tax=Paraliomyxa miuraensis TaxID=376150 RepID=UPI0022520901|nr:hypothetical protein [Paraliomyxa miuraensis]MCX4247427.1 hypothetical protein [Paraliomyxa miuraensis]
MRRRLEIAGLLAALALVVPTAGCDKKDEAKTDEKKADAKADEKKADAKTDEKADAKTDEKADAKADEGGW